MLDQFQSGANLSYKKALSGQGSDLAPKISSLSFQSPMKQPASPNHHFDATSCHFNTLSPLPPNIQTLSLKSPRISSQLSLHAVSSSICSFAIIQLPCWCFTPLPPRWNWKINIKNCLEFFYAVYSNFLNLACAYLQ